MARRPLGVFDETEDTEKAVHEPWVSGSSAEQRSAERSAGFSLRQASWRLCNYLFCKTILSSAYVIAPSSTDTNSTDRSGPREPPLRPTCPPRYWSRSEISGGCRWSLRGVGVAASHPTAELHRAEPSRGESGARWIWYCILAEGEDCSRARTTPGRGVEEPAGTGVSLARRAETPERDFPGGRWNTWT